MEKLMKILFVDGFFNSVIKERPKTVQEAINKIEAIKCVSGVRPGHLLASLDKLWGILSDEAKQKVEKWFIGRDSNFYYYLEDISYVPKGLEWVMGYYKLSEEVRLEVTLEQDWPILILMDSRLKEICREDGLAVNFINEEDCAHDIEITTNLLFGNYTYLFSAITGKELQIGRL